MRLYASVYIYIVYIHHECSFYAFICMFTYDDMIMMLSLKVTRFENYVFKIIKIEPMQVHRFYNLTRSGWDNDNDTMFV